MLDLSAKSECLANLMPNQDETRELVNSVDAKVQKFGSVLDALQTDQVSCFLFHILCTYGGELCCFIGYVRVVTLHVELYEKPNNVEYFKPKAGM